LRLLSAWPAAAAGVGSSLALAAFGAGADERGLHVGGASESAFLFAVGGGGGDDVGLFDFEIFLALALGGFEVGVLVEGGEEVLLHGVAHGNELEDAFVGEVLDNGLGGNRDGLVDEVKTLREFRELLGD
jgi:hypothetical protein